MANTRFGNFSELSQGKKPMDAEEAWIMLKQLGLLGQEFIPGATSVRKLMEGEPREAAEELQYWIPGNEAYQNPMYMICVKSEDTYKIIEFHFRI